MFKAYQRNNKLAVTGPPSLIELEERLLRNKSQDQMPSLVIQATYTE
jgi:hypothetical protein